MDRATQAFRSIGPSREEELAADKAAAQKQLEEQMEQLQQLSGGAMGRAAREAAKQQLLEQQQLRQQGKMDDEGVHVAAVHKSGSRSGGNPFALNAEERARWEADDHLYTEGHAASRAPQQRKSPAAAQSTGRPRGLQQQGEDAARRDVQQGRQLRVGANGDVASPRVHHVAAHASSSSPAAVALRSRLGTRAPWEPDGGQVAADSVYEQVPVLAVPGATMFAPPGQVVEQQQQQAEASEDWDEVKAGMMARARARQQRREQAMAAEGRGPQ